jgi:hypothetical protein
MSEQSERLVIQGTEDAISAVKEAVSGLTGSRTQSKRLQAQAGDPNTWVLVAEVAKVALPVLIPSLVALFGQKRIKTIKIGDVQAENITAAELEALLRSHSGGNDG